MVWNIFLEYISVIDGLVTHVGNREGHGRIYQGVQRLKFKIPFAVCLKHLVHSILDLLNRSG
jgi:hypothetical protein